MVGFYSAGILSSGIVCFLTTSVHATRDMPCQVVQKGRTSSGHISDGVLSFSGQINGERWH